MTRLIVDMSSVLWMSLLAGKDPEFGREVEFEGKPVHVNGWQFGYECAMGHLTSILRELNLTPHQMILVVEGKMSKSRRKAFYEGYKAGRGRPPEAYDEFNRLKEEVVKAFRGVGAIAVSQDGVESDDVISYLCGTLPGDHIILSCKVSGVQDLIGIYRELSRRSDYALHLGLTEAGMGSKGIVASTAAMAVLLQEGIGDTIRVSLTPEPGGKRTQEVVVAQEMLQTMGLRAFTPMVTACPGCGRTTSTFFQELAQSIQTHVRDHMPKWREEFDGVENMTLAVMGCVVNGPGESKHANIGISLPGSGEAPAAPVFEDGVKTVTLRGENIAEEFTDIVDRYVARTYQRKNATKP